jgi:cytochrome c oxidase assembly factor CtaG
VDPFAVPLVALAAALLFSPQAFAHHAEAPFAWSFEPWAAAWLAASGFFYAKGLRRLWRRAGRGRGISVAQASRFALGWAVLAMALLSPIDTLGASSFAMHMVQHELLMVVAAPLLVLGRPLEAWTWSLPPRSRAALGSVARIRWLRIGWKAITDPLGAWTLHAIALWAWHVPAMFEAALANEAIHILQHASFLGTALLLWWSVFDRRPRNHGGHAMASLFATMAHSSALGALITFAPRAWYPSYAAENALQLGPLADQQLGGLIMWGPGGLAYLVAALVIASRWLQQPKWPAASAPRAEG